MIKKEKVNKKHIQIWNELYFYNLIYMKHQKKKEHARIRTRVAWLGGSNANR